MIEIVYNCVMSTGCSTCLDFIEILGNIVSCKSKSFTQVGEHVQIPIDTVLTCID